MSADLIGGNRPRLAWRGLPPFLQRAVPERAGHMPACGLRYAGPVGVAAQHHRRIHRIRDRVLAEQPRSAAAETPPAVVPDLVDALDVRLERRQERGAAVARPGGHPPERAQGGGTPGPLPRHPARPSTPPRRARPTPAREPPRLLPNRPPGPPR